MAINLIRRVNNFSVILGGPAASFSTNFSASKKQRVTMRTPFRIK